jgi:hypothetical protein
LPRRFCCACGCFALTERLARVAHLRSSLFLQGAVRLPRHLRGVVVVVFAVVVVVFIVAGVPVFLRGDEPQSA